MQAGRDDGVDERHGVRRRGGLARHSPVAAGPKKPSTSLLHMYVSGTALPGPERLEQILNEVHSKLPWADNGHR